MKLDVSQYYDMLAMEGNDPVNDPPRLREYMDQWDGPLFLELLELQPTDSVLELGCGTGRLAQRVAPLVKSYCGIDLSPATVQIARTHLPQPNVTLICDDFLTHRFGSLFDTVYSSLTFLHVRDKDRAIRVALGLLRGGGRLVLSLDKNQSRTLRYGDKELEIYPDSPAEITRLLKKHGAVSVTLREVAFAYLLSATVPKP